MSKFIVIEAYVSTKYVGSECVDEYETDITHEEWAEMAEESRESIIQEYLDTHIGNNLDSGAWVKEE